MGQQSQPVGDEQGTPPKARPSFLPEVKGQAEQRNIMSLKAQILILVVEIYHFKVVVS